MLSYDFLNTLVLLVLLALVSVAYLFRLAVRGRVHYERVDRQGSSVLLGKSLMEMAYWSLQPLARLLVTLHVSPNQISWASLVLGGIAGTSLAYGYFGFAALCATASAFLDSLDGMVARMTGHASDAGEVLDAAIDRYVEFFFLAGLVIYYRDLPMLQTIALFALMGSFMVSYSTAKAEAMHVPPPPGIMRRPERAFYLIIGAALSTIPIPWLDEKFPSVIPVGFPMVAALCLIALLGNIAAIERLYTIAHAVRMRELGRQQESEASDAGDSLLPDDPAWHFPRGK